MAVEDQAYERIFGELKSQKGKNSGFVIGVAITVVILTLLLAFLIYDRSRCGPVYTAMRARLDAAGSEVKQHVQAIVKEVVAPPAPEGLQSQFGGLEGTLPPGSQAAEAYQKFERDVDTAHSLARRDEINVDSELAQGFEDITGETRDTEADKQLQKWKAHCSKNVSRGDLERDTFVESKGHGSLGCDINRHILSSFRGEEVAKPVASSGRFTCFQDSSHRHQRQEGPTPADMADFPIMDSAAEGTRVGDIGQDTFFTEQ